MNRSNMNMQMTRGDKMDDESKNASKKMKRGGMTKKKSYAKGGKVKGAGCATKGVSKAKMY